MSSIERIEFKLTMPSRGSWNGCWSGSGRNYTIVRTLGKKKIAELGLLDKKSNSWSYYWSDGWCALVTATKVDRGVRLKKSDGFCGYDWMVSSILAKGRIEPSTPSNLGGTR